MLSPLAALVRSKTRPFTGWCSRPGLRPCAPQKDHSLDGPFVERV